MNREPVRKPLRQVWRGYLSPRRWWRLGISGLPLLVEVASAYRLYLSASSSPLPELIRRMGTARPKASLDCDELVRVTDWFLYPMYGPSRCMPRALMLYRMLSRRGLSPTVVFGVTGEGKSFDGHAWVLLDGEPLAENDDPRQKYVETYRFPFEEKS